MHVIVKPLAVNGVTVEVSVSGVCREALVLVAVPMVASAFSTVITTTPLFAASTLILKRFAAVIFITMLVGLGYVVLFLTPMLAMFGPGVRKKREITEDTPLREVVADMLLKSKGVRFVGMAVLAVLILVRVIQLRCMKTRRYENPKRHVSCSSFHLLCEFWASVCAACVGAAGPAQYCSCVATPSDTGGACSWPFQAPKHGCLLEAPCGS